MTSARIEFPDAIPFSKDGFGVLQNTYGSGRLGIIATHFGGLGKICYYGQRPDDAPQPLFSVDSSSSYHRLFRHQIVVDGMPYNLEFAETRHFSFGYISHFRIGDVEVRHQMTLLDHALIFSVDVISNPKNLRLSQRLEHHGYTAATAPNPINSTASEWEAFPLCEGWCQIFHCRLENSYWEAQQKKIGVPPNPVNLPDLDSGLQESVTKLALFGDRGEWKIRVSHSGRIYFSGEEFSAESSACALLFGEAGGEFNRDAIELRSRLVRIPGKCELSFFARLAAQPLIEAGDKVFESCLANVNPILEGLMPKSVPGGIRASSTFYWIWGWDTLISADIHLLAGRADFVKEMLRLFSETADANYGYAHKFTRNMRVAMAQVPSAQSLYLIQFCNYFSHTEDVEGVQELYPFAKQIFERNLETVNARGLGEGPALFPDYPAFAGHTGHDISVFNNSLLYQGARSMEVMASVAGDAKTAAAASALSRKMEM